MGCSIHACFASCYIENIGADCKSFHHFCFKVTANGSGACVILVFPVVDNPSLFAGEFFTSKLSKRFVKKRNSSAFATCCPIHCRGPILNAKKFLIFDAGKKSPLSSKKRSGLKSIGSLNCRSS